ncbi:hypothetical protein [Chryseobacterium joostei]|uniref:hypothetical protein n=1 Tax=Chryseobacterium joostei TaxID=112234 RepID=UPI003D101F50
MRKLGLIIFTISILLSCKEKVGTEKIVGPDGKLKYIYERRENVTTIFDYAKDGKLMMKLKFKQDQFIDTIYYYDFDTHYTVIDSSKGKYFYGTQVLLFANGKYGYKGTYRFTKNTNPKEAFKSMLNFGQHTTYNTDGNIKEQLEFKIIGDSSYVINPVENNK